MYFGLKAAVCCTSLALLISLIVKVESATSEDKMLFLDAVEQYMFEKMKKASKSRSAEETYPDAIIGGTCCPALFRKWSPIHLSEETNFADYKTNYDKMVDEYLKLGDPVPSQDVCFHKDLFLECKVDSYECHCATNGVWGLYKGKEIDGTCFVGMGGRCLQKDAGCEAGTICTDSGIRYNTVNKNILLCTGVPLQSSTFTSMQANISIPIENCTVPPDVLSRSAFGPPGEISHSWIQKFFMLAAAIVMWQGLE